MHCPQCHYHSAKFKSIRGALLQIFNDIDVRCKYENCGKLIKLTDLFSHESKCQIEKCILYENCGRMANPVIHSNRCMSIFQFAHLNANLYKNFKKIKINLYK